MLSTYLSSFIYFSVGLISTYSILSLQIRKKLVLQALNEYFRSEIVMYSELFENKCANQSCHFNYLIVSNFVYEYSEYSILI